MEERMSVEKERSQQERESGEGGPFQLDAMTIGRVVGTALGGTMIGLGLARRSLAGGALAALGGYLAFEGVSGRGPLARATGLGTDDDLEPAEVVAQESLTIARPRDEVYGRWRRLEDLPQFMHHLEQVVVLDNVRSRWKARGPAGHGHVEWDAELTEDQPGERIAWRSTPDATIQNAGSVGFVDAPGGRGTEIHVRIEYRPPGGRLVEAVAGLLSPAFAQLIKEDLRRFKQLVETGEIPTIEGQPAGR